MAPTKAPQSDTNFTQDEDGTCVNIKQDEDGNVVKIKKDETGNVAEDQFQASEIEMLKSNGWAATKAPPSAWKPMSDDVGDVKEENAEEINEAEPKKDQQMASMKKYNKAIGESKSRELERKGSPWKENAQRSHQQRSQTRQAERKGNP